MSEYQRFQRAGKEKDGKEATGEEVQDGGEINTVLDRLLNADLLLEEE